MQSDKNMLQINNYEESKTIYIQEIVNQKRGANI